MGLVRNFLNVAVFSVFMGQGALALGQTATVGVRFQDVLSQVFEPNCVSCHGPRRASKGVRLDSIEAVQAFITPGNSGTSALVQEIESGSMPPNGQGIAPEKLELLKNWIESGAVN